MEQPSEEYRKAVEEYQKAVRETTLMLFRYFGKDIAYDLVDEPVKADTKKVPDSLREMMENGQG